MVPRPHPHVTPSSRNLAATRTQDVTRVQPDVVYPMPAPAGDRRFTAGLTLDIGKVLAAHGYPPIRSGPDYVRLQSALFGFLYTLTPAASPLLYPLADPGMTDGTEDRP